MSTELTTCGGSGISKHRGSPLIDVVRRFASQIHLVRATGAEVEEEAPDQTTLKETVTVLAMVPPNRDMEDIHRIGLSQAWEVLSPNGWKEGLRLLSLRKTGVILLDPKLFGPTWQDSLRTLLLLNQNLCVVVISPVADDSFWEDVIRAGGYDVLKTPLDDQRVIETVHFAWMFWKVGSGLTGC